MQGPKLIAGITLTLKRLLSRFLASFSPSTNSPQLFLNSVSVPPVLNSCPPTDNYQRLNPQNLNGSAEQAVPFLTQAEHMLIFDESSGKPPALKSYIDTEGFWTIGHGFYLGRTMKDICISPRIAQVMLEESVLEAVRGSVALWGKAFFASLERPRQLGVVNLVFNLGQEKLRNEFHQTVPAIAHKDWPEVKKRLRASLWYKQVKIDRAERVIAALCDCHLVPEYIV
jgi:GH24 family phage-related lysozyme (muramidase)